MLHNGGGSALPVTDEVRVQRSIPMWIPMYHGRAARGSQSSHGPDEYRMRLTYSSQLQFVRICER